MTSRRASLTSHRVAVRLHELFGTEEGARVSAAEVAKALFSRTVYVNRVEAREDAFALMWDYEANGLVADAPGPRGGAGWTLTAKGAALVRDR